jgi:hypothetical protein
MSISLPWRQARVGLVDFEESSQEIFAICIGAIVALDIISVFDSSSNGFSDKSND